MKHGAGLVVAIVLSLASGPTFARTERNSFLDVPVTRVSDLVDQVKSNDKVASRYMRHFGESKEQVLDRLSKLKLSRLKEDGNFVVYNVPGWEEVRARALHYKKGTLVWTDQKGEPMLKASCGNPMVRGSDIGLSGLQPTVALAPSDSVRDMVVANPETGMTAAVPSVMTPGGVEMAPLGMAPAPPPVPGLLPLPPVPFSPIIPAGLLLLLVGNQGGSPPVPEPSSFVVLAFGVAAVIASGKVARR